MGLVFEVRLLGAIGSQLVYGTFFDAIFDIIDVHCGGTSAAEYLTLARRLLADVKRTGDAQSHRPLRPHSAGRGWELQARRQPR